jgi:hypothetical protein
LDGGLMAICKIANGFYTWSDEHFKSMNKKDLINYIRTIEKNWQNALITNDIQYNNCKRLLVEERNKAIDESREIIERAKILLKAYVDMFNSDDNYAEILSQCTTFYDDCECDSHCLKDDMEILLDDIEYWEEIAEQMKGK